MTAKDAETIHNDYKHPDFSLKKCFTKSLCWQSSLLGSLFLLSLEDKNSYTAGVGSKKATPFHINEMCKIVFIVSGKRRPSCRFHVVIMGDSAFGCHAMRNNSEERRKEFFHKSAAGLGHLSKT